MCVRVCGVSSAALGVVSCPFGPCLWSPQESFVDRYSKSFEMNFARADTEWTHAHPDNVSTTTTTRARGGWCYRNCFAMEFSIRQQGVFYVESAKKIPEKEQWKLPYRVSKGHLLCSWHLPWQHLLRRPLSIVVCEEIMQQFIKNRADFNTLMLF